MSKIVFSNHALLRMATYGFSTETIIQIIENPEMIIQEADDIVIYQSLFEKTNGKKYLIRVITKNLKMKKLVITVYRTSRIKKYSTS